MARTPRGEQMISFELVRVSSKSHTIEVGAAHRSIRAICVHRLRITDTPSQRAIAEANKIRSILAKLKVNRKLTIPPPYAPLDSRASVIGNFDVKAGDSAPVVKEGYAKYETVDRPMRTGLTLFTGFDPIVMEVPVTFDAVMSREGEALERDIACLERMAGRGIFHGAGTGFPGYVNVSVTDNRGNVVPLIPRSLQAHKSNTNPPKWVVSGIEWDDEPLRNKAGNRIRQKAVVTLMQYVQVGLLRAPEPSRSSGFRDFIKTPTINAGGWREYLPQPTIK